MNFTESLVAKNQQGQIELYVFIDPSETEKLNIPTKRSFKRSVSFYYDYRGRIEMNYPVVFEDYTTSSGETLVKINRKNIPPAVKSALTKWLKLQ